MTDPLDPWSRRLLDEARTAVLATIAPDGSPRLVPVCYALIEGVDLEPPSLWTPLDEKPKATADVRTLARVRDVRARPDVALLVHRWDEDWSQLAWLRIWGRAELVDPPDAPGSADAGPELDHREAVAALRARYARYRSQAIDAAPLIRITIERTRRWEAANVGAG